MKWNELNEVLNAKRIRKLNQYKFEVNDTNHASFQIFSKKKKSRNFWRGFCFVLIKSQILESLFTLPYKSSECTFLDFSLQAPNRHSWLHQFLMQFSKLIINWKATIKYLLFEKRFQEHNSLHFFMKTD